MNISYTQYSDALLSFYTQKGTYLPVSIEQGLSGCRSLKTLRVCSSYKRTIPPDVHTSVLRGVMGNYSIEELDVYDCDFGKLSLYHLFIVMYK